MRMRLVCFAILLASCSGGTQQITIPPPPPKMSSGTFSGPLCSGDNACKCRDVNDAGDGGAGVPDNPAVKRYEFRLGPSAQSLWATVNGVTMYKSVEQPEECWYLDLPTGVQDVELRASDPNGVSAAWTIRELGTQTKSWYDTLSFNCGSPGVCAFEDLAGIKDDFAKHRVRDACGSTKVKGLTWDTGKAPDQLHPSELVVHAHLEVYKRVPDKQHGDDTCGKPDAAPAGSGDAAN
jgi:hypothetical protein